MGVDHMDQNQEADRSARRVRRLETATPSLHGPGGGGDSGHAGTGDDSIALGEAATATQIVAVAVGYGATATGSASSAYGVNAEAEASYATALGGNAYAGGVSSTAVGDSSTVEGLRGAAFGYGATADGQQGMALGSGAYAEHAYSSAIGTGAETTATSQIMLGDSGTTVVVPGTFSNPSARRLKTNIIPAPVLSDVFPELVEYEYVTAEGRKRVGYIADDLVGSDAERFVTFDDDGRPLGIDYLGMLIVQNAQLNARLVALENLMGE